jgi:hypothetical protein
MAKTIEPTPEDFERAEKSIKDARQNMLEILARSEARKRIERERRERGGAPDCAGSRLGLLGR